MTTKKLSSDTPKLRKREVTVPIIIEKTRTGYSAFSPAVNGCVSSGKSIDATVSNMKEALESHVETEEIIYKKKFNIRKHFKFVYEDLGWDVLYAAVKIKI